MPGRILQNRRLKHAHYSQKSIEINFGLAISLKNGKTQNTFYRYYPFLSRVIGADIREIACLLLFLFITVYEYKITLTATVRVSSISSRVAVSVRENALHTVFEPSRFIGDIISTAAKNSNNDQRKRKKKKKLDFLVQ